MQQKLNPGDDCLIVLIDKNGDKLSLLGKVEIIQVTQGGGSEIIPRVTDVSMAILAEPSLSSLLNKILRGGKTKNYSYYVARRP